MAFIRMNMIYMYLTDEDDLEEELDEATRQFNFWTHQIHIFFVRKFLPAAESMVKLKHAVERRMASDVKQDSRASAGHCDSARTLAVEASQITIEERTQA